MPPKVLVVDTGMLRRPELADFLAKSPGNRVAVSDNTRSECCQGDALRNMESSLRILSRHADQVVILRSEQDLAHRFSADKQVSRADLVDRTQTRHFPGFCEGIRAALAGDLALVRELRKLQEDANKRRTAMKNDVGHLREGITKLAEDLGAERMARIRRHEVLTDEDLRLCFSMIIRLTRDYFDYFEPTQGLTPENSVVASSYPFRKALAGFALIVSWLERGGIGNAKTEKLRNDVIDTNVAAFATYFDGVLTNDSKLQQTHNHARYLLEHMFKVTPGI